MGKRLARLGGILFVCLVAVTARAQDVDLPGEVLPPDGEVDQPAATVSDGGVDVQLQVSDLVEEYDAAATSLTYLLGNIAFGYEGTVTGRGALGPQKFTMPRKSIDEAIVRRKEPRGIIITKDKNEQPVLRIRMAGAKQDVVVRAKFIRSTWFMLTSGKDVTIIAPVDDMQIMRGVLSQVGKGVTPEMRAQLKLPPHADIDALKMRNTRTTGDQVIIQGNNRGLTFSYPQATASYSAELKAVP